MKDNIKEMKKDTKMENLNILRDFVATQSGSSIKINVVKTPTYVSVFYDPTERPSEVILLYREASPVVTVDVTLNEGDKTPGSDLDSFDLTGNPLEDPFEAIENVSIANEKQENKMWLKSEENHLPIPLNEARSLFNHLALQMEGKEYVGQPLDIWALTKPNVGAEFDVKKKKHDILLGLRHSKSVENGKHCWFGRSVVTFEDSCSMRSPEMDPNVMKKEHFKLCGENKNVKSKVLCVYNLSGESRSQATSPPSSPSGSVLLEVNWREPKIEPPLHESQCVMVIQSIVGQSDSTVHPLWKQLWTLERLLESLGNSCRDLRNVDKLPKYPCSSTNLSVGGLHIKSENLSVSEKLKMLFSGGYSSHLIGQSESGFVTSATFSDISDRRTTMFKTEDNLKEFKLKRSLEQVLSNKRINADATDDLWGILLDCETYNELSKSLDAIYREVKQGNWRPYIRHKSQSRTSALLRALSNSVYSDTTDLTVFQASGVNFALESLYELGLEKLAHDYGYIFMESGLASRDELRSPSFPRKSLGVSQEAWLLNCHEYLTWLTKMHASLETLLLTEDALSKTENVFSSVTSQALTYFQGVESPVQSSKFINSNEHCLTFRASVNSHQIGELLSRPFNLWQLTLTSETPTNVVQTVFHRSSFPVFPSQILTGDTEAYVPQSNESSYCRCKSLTLMSRT